MAKPNPQFNTPLSPNAINAELPLYPLYGVTPDNKYTPIAIDENGQLSIGNVTITGPVTVSDVVIKGVDPANSFTTEDISVVNWGIDGYAMRTSIFYQGNPLLINNDGSINVNLSGSIGTIAVSTDFNLDSMSVYGSDGITGRLLRTDTSGNLQVGIVGTPTVAVNNFPSVQSISGTVAATQSGPWTVSLASGSIEIGTVDQGTPNTPTNAWPVKPTDGTNSQSYTASGEAKVVVTQPLPAGGNTIGTVAVSNFPATQPISANALPLPANAAKETGGNLDSINAGLEALNSLVPSTYDYIDLTYTGDDLTTAVFKVGGSTGTVVSILTLTYSDGNLSTVTRT